MNIKTKLGFTLIEILVVVLIIGILGAIALPQYQKAVLKSRFSGMMPIGKALAEANEVFYLEHGNYSENPADLLVAGRNTAQDGAYPDGTRILMYDEDGLSYVRVANDNIPNARYLVYQKHSENFADTTQCEANDDRANELCLALGGELIEGGNSSGEAEWTAYLLSGRYGSTDSFALPKPTCGGVTQPADIEPTETNPATGTATCVNGQWKYTWTGGNVYGDYKSCSGSSAYACAGSTFSGYWSSCDGNTANGCAGSTFSGMMSRCSGSAENVCAGSTFSGEGSSCATTENGCAGSTFSGPDSYCNGQAANACAGTTISGERAYCYGVAANACAGTTIQAGSLCVPTNPGGCDGAKYGANPTGQHKGIGSCYDVDGFCPTGVPINNYSWNDTNGSFDYTWKGNCCNPAYMVSGECPSGIAVCS